MSASSDDKREGARTAALERLSASRTHLRRQLLMHAGVDPNGADGDRPFSIPRRVRALWRSLRRGLRGSPVAAVALTALQDWWRGHPWRATAELLAEELHATLTPIVRRHPLTTMLVSGALGLALVKGRPWRWPSVRRQLQPLPARLARWFFNQLGQAPGQALLSGLLIMLAKHKPEPPQDATSPQQQESKT